jgi:hypothetical protein
MRVAETLACGADRLLQNRHFGAFMIDGGWFDDGHLIDLIVAGRGLEVRVTCPVPEGRPGDPCHQDGEDEGEHFDTCALEDENGPRMPADFSALRVEFEHGPAEFSLTCGPQRVVWRWAKDGPVWMPRATWALPTA